MHRQPSFLGITKTWWLYCLASQRPSLSRGGKVHNTAETAMPTAMYLCRSLQTKLNVECTGARLTHTHPTRPE